MTLEDALRGAREVTRVNLFRNKARGGWEAAVARGDTTSQFAVGQGADPVEALLRALQADAAGRKPRPEPIKAGAPAAAALAQPGPDFSGGIFG